MIGDAWFRRLHASEASIIEGISIIESRRELGHVINDVITSDGHWTKTLFHPKRNDGQTWIGYVLRRRRAMSVR